jgi:pre-rRNA-processing protein TSR2
VAYALHLWPDLTLAVQNNWGGPDSSDKRDWFAGAVVDLFPNLSAPAISKTASASNDEPDDSEPDSAYVEEFLLQVMLDEFEVNVDDDSSYEVAEQILRVRSECAKGKFDEVDALRRRWEGTKGGKVVFKKAEDEDGETDWDTESDEEEDDDDDDDVEMGDAPAPAPKEKQQPEVDEDGFTKVTKKKR